MAHTIQEISSATNSQQLIQRSFMNNRQLNKKMSLYCSKERRMPLFSLEQGRWGLTKDSSLDQTLVRLLNLPLGPSVHFLVKSSFSKEHCKKKAKQERDVRKSEMNNTLPRGRAQRRKRKDQMSSLYPKRNCRRNGPTN
ncbi:hypothetical protein CK820_G0003763 [Pan troglodytes]|uniref:Uncharacterized protein n=1 Tax=Pan troglodytes TaxID=9598 RepID=A0A2J8PBP8_PANTR|nr:hypothetical protein CK820_G0003763 [Pan troglodytes]